MTTNQRIYIFFVATLTYMVYGISMTDWKIILGGKKNFWNGYTLLIPCTLNNVECIDRYLYIFYIVDCWDLFEIVDHHWFFPLIIPPSLNCTVLHSMVIVMVMVMVILIRVWYDFDTNEYLNTFVSRKWHEWMYSYEIFWNERISEYIIISKIWYKQISE